MILKWKGSRVWAIGMAGLEGMSVVLRPGLNTVKSDEWNQVKDTPDVKARLKANQLEIVEDDAKKSGKKDESKDSSGAQDIGSLNVDKAKALIADTYSVKQLNAWKEPETRSGVIKAIDAQLEKIEKERSGTDTDEDAPQE